MATTDVTVLSNHAPSVVDPLERQERELQLKINQLEYDTRSAQMMAKAGVFPGAREEAKAYAAIMIGRSLGMEDATALMSVEFGAQGKPMISVHWQAAQIRQRGHDFEIVEHDTSKCTIAFYRKRNGELKEMPPITFSIDEARKIAVADKMQGDKGATLGNKWNWRSWTKEMLYAHVMRRGVRWYYPEILGGYAGTEEQETDEQMLHGIQEGQPMTHERGVDACNDLFGSGPVVTGRDADPQPPDSPEEPAADNYMNQGSAQLCSNIYRVTAEINDIMLKRRKRLKADEGLIPEHEAVWKMVAAWEAVASDHQSDLGALVEVLEAAQAGLAMIES